jgi:hypothetical protein
MYAGGQQLGTRLRPLLLPYGPLRPFHERLPRPSEICRPPLLTHLGRSRVLGTLHTRRPLPLDGPLWGYLGTPLLIRGTRTKGAEFYTCSRVGVGREVDGYASHCVCSGHAGGRKGMAAFLKWGVLLL